MADNRSRALAVRTTLLAAAGLLLVACNDGRPSTEPTCAPAAARGSGAPRFVRNLSFGNTGWFSSPAVIDLDGDGEREIVAPFYDVAVWSAEGTLLHRLNRGEGRHVGRVYAPAVVADLDRDGTFEVVVAAGEGTVAAYEWRGGELVLKSGWPASTCANGQCPENRSLAAGDLDGDTVIEVVVATTQTAGEGHVYVFNPDGTLFQPAGISWPAWPRYNELTGPGGDADIHCTGHHGYGCFGQNLAVGNVDDDPDLEIVATYDNHHIQLFNPDGTAIDADPSYFRQRSSDCRGEPLTWGQFIRWLDPEVEENHYHLHTGEWPHPSWAYWLQWTHSPPAVADLDGDGRNEVFGFPNVEKDEPYHTYHFALVVLQGDYAATGHASGRRLPGFERPPLSEEPWQNDGWYPVAGMPSPVTANIAGDDRPEILGPINDGYLYAFSSDGSLLWRHNYARGIPLTYASEPAVVDLTGDGRPEIVFGTWSDSPGDGRLVILSAGGSVLHDISLPGQQENGNGVGAAACPTIADVDGDGQIEILLLTIDHGLDIFTVPGSSANCTVAGADATLYPGLWTTGRGNYLRNGRGPAGGR